MLYIVYILFLQPFFILFPKKATSSIVISFVPILQKFFYPVASAPMNVRNRKQNFCTFLFFQHTHTHSKLHLPQFLPETPVRMFDFQALFGFGSTFSPGVKSTESNNPFLCGSRAGRGVVMWPNLLISQTLNMCVCVFVCLTVGLNSIKLQDSSIPPRW